MTISIVLILQFIEIISSASNPRLLIISLDGFRHQYLKQYPFEALNRVENEGIKSKNGMQPTFVTMTYPNHISIATGMYQEDHGIIHNRFFDTNLQKIVTFDTRDEGQWSDTKVEPLWITATKQGKKSAVLFWPAAHNEFHGARPLIYSWLYTDNISMREKIDNTVSYFRENVVELVMLYHFEPDKQGHVYGPDSDEIHETLIRLDGDINYLLEKVKRELDDDLNIIILSDHGMANTVRTVQPFRDGYVNRSSVEDNILDGTLFSVTPRSGQFEQVLNGLRLIPGVKAYKREEFPERFHYAKAVNRLGEIIVVPDSEGVVFSQATGNVSVAKGNHGYDNILPSMQAIFMAKGPDFNRHIEIDSLKNVDIYHIACKILNLKPNPYAKAGSIDNLTSIFHLRANHCSQKFLNMSVVVLACFLYFTMVI
ncbi:unnamed protein product [Rotaria socialis]|uniref:Uncharacterized protein n=1 Tax=Rotaria socialis TaxID=392032 RepID=A0A818YRL8_9BILA|nr:unnamed protein product [Rotaria socialis]CAF3758110.1 unnamed protein product [Rotaria socialis]CAF4354533.1 unnamed protein product [Rotaria socialis]CAF4644020.1 unnamed protein product [Rotaria socialis]